MNESLHYCVGGLSCLAQLTRAVKHYAGDDGLDFEGIGEQAADQFVEAGLVDDRVVSVEF
jgi:DNA ligase (NAD+)